VVKRKLKVFAYRKAHRLLRIGHRKAGHPKRDLVDGVTVLLFNKDTEEVDEEDIRKKRMEQNKEWRRRKEIEKCASLGQTPPSEVDPEAVKEKIKKAANKFEKKLHKQFLCTNCRKELLNEVWECLDGHSTCENCFDRENIGIETSDNYDEDEERSDVLTTLKTISRKSSTFSRRDKSNSLDSLKRDLRTSTSSIATICSIDTIISLRDSLSVIAEGDEDDADETKSFQKYLVNEIDFFLNTLEVRKDAISFYNDYNNEYKSIFYNPDIEGISLDGEHEDNVIKSNEYKDEKSERVKKYIKRLKEQGSLASLRETLMDVVETNEADIDPSWATFRLEEIDFFLNTLNIRKDAIGYYGDYHNGNTSIFDHLRALEESGEDQDSDSIKKERNISDGQERKVTKCKICNKFIVRRNVLMENLAKVYFQV